jgi:hypothetical protein
MRIPVAAREKAVLLATLPGPVDDSDGASVSPDGRQIFASVSEEKSDVWLMENFDPPR